MRVLRFATSACAVLCMGCIPGIRDLTPQSQPSQSDLTFRAEIRGVSQLQSVTLEHNAGGSMTMISQPTPGTDPVFVVPKPSQDWLHCTQVRYKWKIEYLQRFSFRHLFSSTVQQFESPQFTLETFNFLETPTPQTPANNAAVPPGTIQFGWSPVPCADAYTISIFENKGGGPIQILREPYITGTSFTPAYQFTPGSYAWTVNAEHKITPPMAIRSDYFPANLATLSPFTVK